MPQLHWLHITKHMCHGWTLCKLMKGGVDYECWVDSVLKTVTGQIEYTFFGTTLDIYIYIYIYIYIIC